MTMFAGIATLAMATCVGYYFGRRGGSRPSTWKQRTSRITLGKLAISLLVLLTARRIRHSFRHSFRLGHMSADVVQLCGLRFIAPLELLWASVARIRCY
jgi:hypothetical protein